jgi:hypothetical protein
MRPDCGEGKNTAQEYFNLYGKYINQYLDWSECEPSPGCGGVGFLKSHSVEDRVYAALSACVFQGRGQDYGALATFLTRELQLDPEIDPINFTFVWQAATEIICSDEHENPTGLP